MSFSFAVVSTVSVRTTFGVDSTKMVSFPAPVLPFPAFLAFPVDGVVDGRAARLPPNLTGKKILFSKSLRINKKKKVLTNQNSLMYIFSNYLI